MILLMMMICGWRISFTEGFTYDKENKNNNMMLLIKKPSIFLQQRTLSSMRQSSIITLNANFDLPFLQSLDVEDEKNGGSSWQSQLLTQPYVSAVLWENDSEWKDFVVELLEQNPKADPLWEQIRLEAIQSLQPEPTAGPQLYQSILSQKSLIDALVSIIANELETEFFTAMELQSLFMQILTQHEEDYEIISNDVIAAASRSPSMGTALSAILFQTGLHALVCYRVGHHLWNMNRKGLSYYLQSLVSRKYSTDIHPACQMGYGIYLSTTAGVVIGETAVIGNDVSILQGVTLGGTGKERGNRHPKVSHGVILCDGATVLGNIPVGTGAIITSKSIVTKPVPPLAIMAGVPAKIQRYRDLGNPSVYDDDLSHYVTLKYLKEWQSLLPSKDELST